MRPSSGDGIVPNSRDFLDEHRHFATRLPRTGDVCKTKGLTGRNATDRTAVSRCFSMRIEISPGYFVDYIEGFLEAVDADDLLRWFLAEEMTPEIVRMYGRDV